LLTSAFSTVELILASSLLIFVSALIPAPEGSAGVFAAETWSNPLNSLPFAVSYAVSILFLEPFYVSAGFALYLNRRVELEAWDIEQEFRRAFER
jgi:hypothetical protein